MAEQQVNLTDLDPAQLQEVKKQLDSVSYTSYLEPYRSPKELMEMLGA